jgi:hypothetical protein
MRAAEQASRTAKSDPERVAAAIQNIRAFHELGRNLPTKYDRPVDASQGTIDAEAKRLNINADTLRKARVFADPEDGWSKQELRDLCGLIRKCQKERSGKKKALPMFQRTHVIRLQSVRPKKQRTALQEECIRAGWSCTELEREIRTRYRTRREGGRRRALPEDAAGLLTQLRKLCVEWRRWHTSLTRLNDDKSTREKDLPLEIRRQVHVVNEAINELYNAVEERLSRQRQ